MSAKKPTVKLYQNGIESFGAPITIKQLREALNRCTDLDENAPVMSTSDEEGNRIGYAFSIIFDYPSGNNAESLGIYDQALAKLVNSKGALVITPAI